MTAFQKDDNMTVNRKDDGVTTISRKSDNQSQRDKFVSISSDLDSKQSSDSDTNDITAIQRTKSKLLASE